MKKNQYGYSIVEILVILVVVGLLGAIGWFVYDKQNKPESNAGTSNIQTNNTASATEKNDKSTADEEAYLTIKEWGVKFRLSSGILDASYFITEFDGDTHFFITQALKGTDCTGGYVIKFQPSAYNGETKQLYINEFPDAIKIEEDYYAYGLNPVNVECSEDKSIQAEANQAATEFEKAFKTIQAVN